MKLSKTSELKRLRERIADLEAMVAMAEPPSPDKWPPIACLSWTHKQKIFQRKLDKVASRMKANEGEVCGE